MFSTATLVQTASAVPYSLLFSMTIYLALFGGIALFFRPLLVGIGRALYLTVRPRPSKSAMPSKSAWSRSIADLLSPSLKRGTGYGSRVFFRLSLCIPARHAQLSCFQRWLGVTQLFLASECDKVHIELHYLEISRCAKMNFRPIYANEIS